MSITKISKAINNIICAIQGEPFSRVPSPSNNTKCLDNLAEVIRDNIIKVGSRKVNELDDCGRLSRALDPWSILDLRGKEFTINSSLTIPKGAIIKNGTIKLCKNLEKGIILSSNSGLINVSILGHENTNVDTFAIYAENIDTINIEKCTISNATQGIRGMAVTNATIKDCNIHDMYKRVARGGCGIYLYQKSNNAIITRNTIYNCGNKGIGVAYETDNVIINYNEVYNINEKYFYSECVAIELFHKCNYSILNNNMLHDIPSENYEGDAMCWPISLDTGTGNKVFNNLLDIDSSKTRYGIEIVKQSNFSVEGNNLTVSENATRNVVDGAIIINKSIYGCVEKNTIINDSNWNVIKLCGNGLLYGNNVNDVFIDESTNSMYVNNVNINNNKAINNGEGNIVHGANYLKKICIYNNIFESVSGEPIMMFSGNIDIKNNSILFNKSTPDAKGAITVKLTQSNNLTKNILVDANIINTNCAGIVAQSQISELYLEDFNILNNIFNGCRTAIVGGGLGLSVIDKNAFNNCTNLFWGDALFLKSKIGENKGYSGIYYRDSIPTTGFFNVGNKIINTNPNSNNIESWICTESGNPGTWTPNYIFHYQSSDNAPTTSTVGYLGQEIIYNSDCYKCVDVTTSDSNTSYTWKKIT